MLEQAQIYVIGGKSIRGTHNFVQRLAVSSSGNVTKSLKDGPKVPVESLYASSAVVDDSRKLITLIGGKAMINKRYEYHLVWNLNVLGDYSGSPSWTRGPDLITGRYHHCSCRQGHTIYVVGGIDESFNYLSSVEMLDTSQSSPKWTLIKPYHMKVKNPACVVVGDEIWVSGGLLDSVYVTRGVYSWNTTTWQVRPMMLKARYYHTMVAYNGQIWAMFGLHNSVEVYENNKWKMLYSLPERHINGPIVMWNKTLINVSGQLKNPMSSFIFINNVFTGNATTDHWSESTTSIHTAVVWPAVVLVTP